MQYDLDDNVLDTFTLETYQKTMDEDVSYGNYILPSVEHGNQKIEEFIKARRPFAIARLGETEQRVIGYGLHNSIPKWDFIKQRRILQNECANWCEGAGFFPKKLGLLPKFIETYLKAFEEIDMLAIWGQKYEPYLLNKYMQNACVCRAKSLAVVENEIPWTRQLKGMKVLVISPFAESIEKQYEKRLLLHKNDELLPEFELKTLKAVQSPRISGKRSEHRNWFCALDWMYNETIKTDYDVALLGCGAYAVPLSALIKSSGHGAITTCGGTQLIFGIMGKRWDTPYYREFLGVNENWVYPSGDEIPYRSKWVENSCYWK